MIAFAPLEELPPPPPPPKQTSQGAVAVPKNQAMFVGSTECSYLLMFFVFGVVALSIKDMAASR
jgi:hypothetical protein